MSTLAVRDTRLVTETQWERLYRIVEERRRLVGLTLAGIQAVGGPSPKWVQNLRTMQGGPTNRMRAPMAKLDSALHWPAGTTWGLVADDRSNWSDIVLQDEEAQLLEVVDEVDQFALVVAVRLRAIPEGSERDEAMRRVLDVLDVRP